MNKVIEKLKQIGVIPLAVFKDEKAGGSSCQCIKQSWN